MTSKEAYNYLLGLLESGGDMRWSLVKESMDKFKELIDQSSDPTLSECIKEWEERGWKQFKGCFSILNFEKGKDAISFKLAPIEYYCWSTEEDGYSVFINSDLNNLIHKTLKALEVEE